MCVKSIVPTFLQHIIKLHLVTMSMIIFHTQLTSTRQDTAIKSNVTLFILVYVTCVGNVVWLVGGGHS